MGTASHPAVQCNTGEHNRRLYRENTGMMKTDGESLNNRRFADNIFLYTGTPHNLHHVLQEISTESRPMGLEMNITTTTVMVEDTIPSTVNNLGIAHVEE